MKIKVPKCQKERIKELSRLLDVIRKYRLLTVKTLQEFGVGHGNFYNSLQGYHDINDETYIKAHLLIKGIKQHYGNLNEKIRTN